MKFFTIFFLLVSTLFSKVYYSKVEPIETRVISSNVSGIVLMINEDLLGSHLSKDPYIKIDSKIENDELGFIKQKLFYLKQMLTSNESILKNLQNIVDKKRINYTKIKALKIKSTIEKDREFYDLVSSENLYFSTLKEINSLKVQIADLNLREVQLLQILKEKNLCGEGLVLYTLNVKVGQVVNKGTLLAKLSDTSKALLTIYLDALDVPGAKKKTLFIDGVKTDYKIQRIFNLADEKNISKYKAQIIIDAPKIFSKLVKIEMK